MSVWKAVGQQVGGLAKHVAKQVVKEPVEVVENALGVSDPSAGSGQENQAMEALEQGMQGQQQNTGSSTDPNQPKGFKTIQDYHKYQHLSGRKDEMELAMLRKQLGAQWGLRTDIDSGMQQARVEYEQKEQERKQVVEKEKEEKKWVVEQKKKEDLSVVAAKQASSAENKAWGAG